MTTPTPVYVVDDHTPAPPDRLGHKERATYRDAAYAARHLYPGPVGELLARELQAIDEFGYRIGVSALAVRARDQILAAWRTHTPH